MPLFNGRFTKKANHACRRRANPHCRHHARSPLFALNVAHAHVMRHPVHPRAQAALLLEHRQTLPNRQTARPAPRLCLATVG